MFHRAHFKEPHLRIPRPGDDKPATEPERLATPEELRTFFAR